MPWLTWMREGPIRRPPVGHACELPPVVLGGLPLTGYEHC